MENEPISAGQPTINNTEATIGLKRRFDYRLRFLVIGALLPINVTCSLIDRCGQWEELNGPNVEVLECPKNLQGQLQSTKLIQGRKLGNSPNADCEFQMDLPKVSFKDLGPPGRSTLLELAVDPVRCIALYGEISGESGTVSPDLRSPIPTAIPADLSTKPSR